MSAVNFALLEQARRYALEKNPLAKKAFQLVLDNNAFDADARIFLGSLALEENSPNLALEHLLIASRLVYENPHVWRKLAATHLALGDLEQAREALLQALRIKPNMHVARLQLGKVEELLGNPVNAMRTYLHALSAAQREGKWLDENSTPHALQADVQHAIQMANHGRETLYALIMDALLARFEKTELTRVDLALKANLGYIGLQSPDPLQRPNFLYFPELPNTPVFDNALFPWFEQLENQFESIRDEAANVLEKQSGISPFLNIGPKDSVADYLGGEQPNWDAYFFYRHGKKYEANHVECPRTSAILEALPLVRIPDHAPEICFSVLTAGTHILPHYGTSNIRSVVHLPLIVPEQCALKVSDQILVGVAGKCLSFDDTYLHEAWNKSEQTRVILLMDTWNPHLTDIEKLALTEMITQLGDFNRV